MSGTERSQASFNHLEDWGFIWWPTALGEIAGRALPERWDNGDASLDGLRNYLLQTFNKLSGEHEVLVSADGSFAAFNSGLVTASYDDIYLCFVPNERSHPQWFYKGACVAGERGLGKRLVDSFSPLPRAATYFTDVRELVFDPEATVYPDYRHIVIENIARLPHGFLREQLFDSPEALAALERVWGTDPGEDELEDKDNAQTQAALDGLKDVIEGDSRLYLRLKNRVEDAVNLACKRARWNYRTGVPSYYPRFNEVNLLLPLYLEDGATPSVALAVRLGDAGNYQGETILTMQMAYRNARLICRPENDWLCL